MKRCLRSPRLSPLSVAIALATGGPLLLQGGYANAQNQAPGEPVEEITVTGSRIQRTSGFTTPVPVTAVTVSDLESFKPGATMADQLDQLPQFFQTQSAQRGGGALFGGAGRSVVDLRAMGPARTLILLDGARLAPADRDGSVHIDNIPTALLSQVEVVTGGASAAYGADALAGVTNFRLNRTYDGMDVSVNTGATSDGMGDNRRVSVAYGSALGERGHVIASVEHQQIDPIEYDPLELGDWFQRYGIVANPAWSAGNTSVPARLVLPDVYSRNHAPTGRIGTARTAAGATVGTFALAGQVFTDNGTGVRPFSSVGAISGGTATGNQSGGTEVINGMTEAQRADRAFNGGPVGAEVERSNAFVGYTFDANESTRLFANLLAGRTQSNDYDQRGIPHMASPWTTQIFVDNAYLPANVRQAMVAQGVNNFVMEKQGQWLRPERQLGRQRGPSQSVRQLDLAAWLGQGHRRKLADAGAHSARRHGPALAGVQRDSRRSRDARGRRGRGLQRPSRSDRRYDRSGNGQLHGGSDGRPDIVNPALRGTGTIRCNVQRYNPTQAQLQAAVANIRVPAAQGDSSLGNGDPTFPVPIPSPVGPDAIPNCVPMNIFGQGNVSAAAADYAVSEKSGVGAVTQEFAEVLFTGEIYEGYGPGAFSMAVGATWREQWFWQAGLPVDLMRYGPPVNAPTLGIRGIQGGFTTGSPNLHEFSTVPTINGGYDVWEAFTEFNLPLWESDSGAQRLELDVAARYSDYSTSGGINSNKVGHQPQGHRVPAVPHDAFARRSRADVRGAVRRAGRRRQHHGARHRQRPDARRPAASGQRGDGVPDHEHRTRQPGPRRPRRPTRSRPASSSSPRERDCSSPSTGTTSTWPARSASSASSGSSTSATWTPRTTCASTCSATRPRAPSRPSAIRGSTSTTRAFAGSTTSSCGTATSTCSRARTRRCRCGSWPAGC